MGHYGLMSWTYMVWENINFRVGISLIISPFDDIWSVKYLFHMIYLPYMFDQMHTFKNLTPFN